MKKQLLLLSVSAVSLIAACDVSGPDGAGEGEGEGEVECRGDDPFLGTLTLANGNSVVGTPGGLDSAVLFVSPGGTYGLTFGLDVVSLSDGNVVFSARDPGETSDGAFPAFIDADRDVVVAGYNTFEGGGAIALFDIGQAAVTYLPAPSVQSGALGFGSVIVNGAGVGALSGALGIYAHRLDDDSDVLLAEIGDGNFSGYTAVVSLGGEPVLLAGRFAAAGNELFAFGPTSVANALAGAPLSFGTPVFVGGGVGIARYRQGVAVVRIDDNFNGVGVDHIALTRSGDTVTAAPAKVLVNGDGCTSIPLIAPGDQDLQLLLGVDDGDARRLVRIAVSEG